MLSVQQDTVKRALLAANESGRRRRWRAAGMMIFCLLLTFSVWRIVRPRAQLTRLQAAAAESVRVRRRRPLPAHILALRSATDLRLVEEEEPSSLHTRARNATNHSYANSSYNEPITVVSMMSAS